jgi:topoisomerase-4 subunit B
MRLSPVSITGIGEIARCLEFFMGRNTPERRAFIVDHLAPDVVQ